jgi:predicted DNA repair protein MutK
MPTPSLLVLLDDIASVLDDVAVLSKVATKKTAGVLGDDLALNAEQVSGVRAERELPVVWAVAKGSLVNKAILVPAALAVSAVMPWAITPLLVLGGVFLCFEGCEKLVHKFWHDKAAQREQRAESNRAVADPAADLLSVERDKIKGAIRTDFVLSAEIVVIALGTVAAAPLATQLLVLVGLSLLMTVGVYGLVAGIVKLDDLGQHLAERGRRSAAALAGLQTALASGILLSAPWLMKGLSVAGTVAMFLVGGGIVSHALPGLHELLEPHSEPAREKSGIASVLAWLVPTLADLLIGVLAGTLALLIWSGAKRLLPGKSAH